MIEIWSQSQYLLVQLFLFLFEQVLELLSFWLLACLLIAIDRVNLINIVVISILAIVLFLETLLLFLGKRVLAYLCYFCPQTHRGRQRVLAQMGSPPLCAWDTCQERSLSCASSPWVQGRGEANPNTSCGPRPRLPRNLDHAERKEESAVFTLLWAFSMLQLAVWSLDGAVWSIHLALWALELILKTLQAAVRASQEAAWTLQRLSGGDNWLPRRSKGI